MFDFLISSLTFGAILRLDWPWAGQAGGRLAELRPHRSRASAPTAPVSPCARAGIRRWAVAGVAVAMALGAGHLGWAGWRPTTGASPRWPLPRSSAPSPPTNSWLTNGAQGISGIPAVFGGMDGKAAPRFFLGLVLVLAAAAAVLLRRLAYNRFSRLAGDARRTESWRPAWAAT